MSHHFAYWYVWMHAQFFNSIDKTELGDDEMAKILENEEDDGFVLCR